MEAVLERLAGDTLVSGQFCRSLARGVARRIGAAGAICLREYHRAIAVAFDMLNLRPGDRAILSPLAPAAYYETMQERSVVPLFADIDPQSGLIAPDSLEAMLNQGAAVCIGDAALGHRSDAELLAQRGVALIEDISTALGTKIGKEQAGGYGDVTIVGLEARHIITGGGGALIAATGDAAPARLKEAAARLPPETLLPEMNSALAYTQLKQLDYFLERRAEIAARHAEALARGARGAITRLRCDVHFSFPIRVESGAAEIIKYASQHDVECRAAYEATAIGRHTLDSDLPVARDLLRRTLLFPIYPALSTRDEKQIQRVLATLP